MILRRGSRISYTVPSPTPILARKAKSETVQVVVRCRPMSLKERTQGHTQIIDMWPQQGIVYISNPKRNHTCAGKTFAFDSVYDWNANQDDLYKRTVQPLVYSVLDGFNGTIFAYGQTGTGKTYTMLGSRGNPKEKGIIAKCFEEIFSHIGHNGKHTSYVVRASYFEIYQEETRDLLSQDMKKKPLREDVVRGVYVKGLQSVVCKNLKAIERVMRVGNVNRATAATNMNEHSSRSHAIFQITVEMQDREAKEAGLGHGLRVGKLNLVDLAGSERQCKTGAVGERLKESGKINLSLSALGNVISALVNGKSSHIPYRDSKLTQLLQDSLGGNSKSIMIANIGPASYNYDESLMTLRYASRAKHIRNHPVRNEDDINSVFSQYNEEVRSLKRLVIDQDTSSSNVSRGVTSSSEQDESQGHSPSSACCEDPITADRGVENAYKNSKNFAKLRSKSRVDEIRRRRLQRRVVWRLRGKYHQETTIKMVKWLQDQMAQSSEGRGVGTGDGQGESLFASKETQVQQPVQNIQVEARRSLTETELSTQQLIDDLSYLVRRKSMLTSIAQLAEQNRRRKKQVRALMQLAAEVDGMQERVQQEQQQEKEAVLSEKRRLLRELALRSAVVRSYFADGNSARRINGCSCYDHHHRKLWEPAPKSADVYEGRTRRVDAGDADNAFPILPASVH